MNYQDLIKKLTIVDKNGQAVPFILNDFQVKFLNSMTNRDIILKARQIGFSSLILAIFTWDFLLKENSRSVCISHDAVSATKLFDRVKYYLKCLVDQGVEIPLKYNSRNEMLNAAKNSSFYIGQAGSKAFGRGDTLSNLHLSEFAFYEDPERLLGSVLQAVVPGGRVIIESTASGMNYFKSYWDKSKNGETGFKTHFFENSFYSPEFLKSKEMELGKELFLQEYPATDLEAFLSSGETFFEKESLEWYLNQVREPAQTLKGYYDLSV